MKRSRDIEKDRGESEDAGSPAKLSRTNVETSATVESEYLPFTSGVYPFSVCLDNEGSKWMRSESYLPKDMDILVESPLICWPVGASVNNWSLISFCEHCLKILPPEVNKTLPEVQVPSTASCCSASFDAKVEQSFEKIPSEGRFCSDICSIQAIDGGVRGGSIGWFKIIGGSEAIRKLREADWKLHQRGDQTVYRSSSPVPIEAIARYLASIAWRFTFVKEQFILQNQKEQLDENVEDNIFSNVCRVFERFVAPAVKFGKLIIHNYN